MARAFCFDLDGTLMDSEVIWVEVVEKFLRSVDPAVTHEEALNIVYGRSWHDVYVSLRQRLPGMDQTLSELMETFDVQYHRLMNLRDVRIDGSLRLLRRLAKSLPVCIVSGSTRSAVEDGIAMMGLGPFLQFYLCSEDFQPGKPDPGCYKMAVERLGVPAGECMAFEDSEAGMRAARLAGLYCVGLARPGAPVQNTSSAHRVMSDLGLLDPDELLACRADGSLL